MTWLLVFHIIIWGNDKVIIERFETEAYCRNAGAAVAEAYPKITAKYFYSWQCYDLSK